MVMMVIINGARASNIINITTKDVLNAKVHDEFPGYVFNSKKYKTSLIYGTKTMAVPIDIFPFFTTYINDVRPILASPSSIYLFTSMRGKDGSKMEHSLVSNAMTKSFELANILINKTTRISPSRLRCSVVTDLVGVNGENCAVVAEQFMKHRESTSKKFYISHWANRESMRLSMKCYSRFLTKDVEPIVKERKNLMTCTPPNKCQILRWMKENAKKIKSTFNNDLDDDAGLLECLGEMDEDEGNVNFQCLSNSLLFYFIP